MAMTIATKPTTALVAVWLLVVGVGAAHAAPITYTETGIFSGRLGSFDFVDAAITFTAMADTADVGQNSSGFFAVDVTHRTTVTMGSFGTFPVYDSVSVFDIQAD